MNTHASAYLTLKLAQQLYQKNPDILGPEERKRVDAVASKQRQLEALILATPEAAQVALPESSVKSSLAEIRKRYPNDDDFHADLDRIGLSEASLKEAVQRDLTVEAVLDKVATRAAKVSDTEVEIFYFMHKERFTRPASRTLRHILITVNPDYKENDREAALARLQDIRKRLLKEPKRFEEQALKHSECPTAMNGGLLGNVTPGQLYAELEPAAFALQTGEISQVLESPVGFHIIRCDAINEVSSMPLQEARERVYKHLMEQRQRICQKAWINSLQRPAEAESAAA
ncbi:MAG: nitrogen fixation protein NifM [Rhodocyclaceae bacterium]|nr:MAG: nitrogen fixation protein NifM [Rhodocyclaceae bacterium]